MLIMKVPFVQRTSLASLALPLPFLSFFLLDNLSNPRDFMWILPIGVAFEYQKVPTTAAITAPKIERMISVVIIFII